MLYVGRSFVSRLYENKVHGYLATRPEAEGFRDQGFVLQIYLKYRKPLTSEFCGFFIVKRGARHQFVNSKARFDLLYTRALHAYY